MCGKKIPREPKMVYEIIYFVICFYGCYTKYNKFVNMQIYSHVNKVIIHKSHCEVSLVEQDTIENVS